MTWNSAFEATPADGDNPKFVGERIREIKEAFRERLEVAHVGGTAEAQVRHGEHRAGSCRPYYQTGAPTVKPDGVTAIDGDDHGRLWLSSATGIHRYSGSEGVWKMPLFEYHYASNYLTEGDVFSAIGSEMVSPTGVSSFPGYNRPADGYLWDEDGEQFYRVYRIFRGPTWVTLYYNALVLPDPGSGVESSREAGSLRCDSGSLTVVAAGNYQIGLVIW